MKFSGPFQRISFFLVICSLAIGVCLTVMAFSVKENPFSIVNWKQAYMVKSLVPEGWGFFTRNPREDKIRYFRILNGTIEEIDLLAGSPDNYLGLSRKIRRKSLEFARVNTLIAESSWLNFEGLRSELQVPENAQYFELSLDPEKYHVLKKGKYLVYQYQTIPWEWSQITEIEKGKVAFIDIKFE